MGLLRQQGQGERRIAHNAVYLLVQKVDQEADAVFGHKGLARLWDGAAKLSKRSDSILKLLL